MAGSAAADARARHASLQRLRRALHVSGKTVRAWAVALSVLVRAESTVEYATFFCALAPPLTARTHADLRRGAVRTRIWPCALGRLGRCSAKRVLRGELLTRAQPHHPL